MPYKEELIASIKKKYQPEEMGFFELPPNALPMGGQTQSPAALRTIPRAYREALMRYGQKE